MFKLLFTIFFKLTGWRLVGEPPKLKKYVAIAAPHTSGWDLIYGLGAKFIWDIKAKFFGKQELFFFPLGNILRSVGGLPVDRFSKHGVVEIAVEKFNTHDEFILAMAPEGTRDYAPVWRKGFYYIALQAQVPIALGYIDFGKKEVGFGPTFYPTGNYDADIVQIMNFYKPIQGKHPEKGVR